MTFPGRALPGNMAKMLQEASLLSPLFARDRFEPTTPLPGSFGAKTIMKMSKPKPKMLQEASPSLLSPLFERVASSLLPRVF
ncbi:hypothetical protein L596_009372 [Steinernema carpocapsae]|uniref:Uncharacterized protein n=1 Tax=Steinernema carpocapsae TaxID=34508 RepID=A0A4U5PF57_STECR|nr:hypothetical protein L596_009372 [Steinernema carpocapsae]